LGGIAEYPRSSYLTMFYELYNICTASTYVENICNISENMNIGHHIVEKLTQIGQCHNNV
jgi:hypothetical protein